MDFIEVQFFPVPSGMIQFKIDGSEVSPMSFSRGRCITRFMLLEDLLEELIIN